MEATQLTETSPELLEALENTFANTEWRTDVLHTGGGCMVARIFHATGTEIWLTREENWVVGFYNFKIDVQDEGICFNLHGFTNYQTGGSSLDDPEWVAQQIFEMLLRLGPA